MLTHTNIYIHTDRQTTDCITHIRNRYLYIHTHTWRVNISFRHTYKRAHTNILYAHACINIWSSHTYMHVCTCTRTYNHMGTYASTYKHTHTRNIHTCTTHMKYTHAYTRHTHVAHVCVYDTHI